MIPIIIARPGRAEPPRRWSCSSLANMLAAADAETQGRRSIGQMGADRGARAPDGSAAAAASGQLRRALAGGRLRRYL